MQLARSHYILALAALPIALDASAHAAEVGLIPLVTDDQLANPAQITDPGLTNAWGMSYSQNSPFWVSSNGGGTANLYRVDPMTQATTKVSLSVKIPGDGSVTGQVFNGTSDFGSDAFLFVSEDGTVSGWRNAIGTNAETLTSPSDTNVYKGMALATIGANTYAYAANFHTGAIDVFKGNPGAPVLTGTFLDPSLPSGFAPFNVQNIGGTIYVTYAQQVPGSNDEADGPGLGFVDAFDLNGNLLRKVASGGKLDAPWGLAIAPSSFGDVAGSLLVGNFGDGRISAFNPLTGDYLGQLLTANGSVLSIDGLWGLSVGNNGGAGSSDALYFTAGPGDERHGLLGVLVAVPEPATWLLTIVGFGMIGATMRKTSRRQGLYASSPPRLTARA
jgi:uncharacterized protein (TIGR03118 family)